MKLLADVHVKTAYVTALRGDGHEVVRVVDVDGLGQTATDREIIVHAGKIDAAVLTNDTKDFGQFESHSGVIIVPQTGMTGGEISTAVSRIERLVPDLSGLLLYTTDWA
jgi:hypothetical protein